MKKFYVLLLNTILVINISYAQPNPTFSSASANTDSTVEINFNKTIFFEVTAEDFLLKTTATGLDLTNANAVTSGSSVIITLHPDFLLPENYSANDLSMEAAIVTTSNGWTNLAVIDEIIDDLINPTIKEVKPVSGSTGLTIDTSFMIIFNEPVTTGTGAINFYDDQSNLFETIAIPDVLVTFNNTDTVIINHSVNFQESTNYYIQIESTVITDTSSAQNQYIGISDNSSWVFKTGDFTMPSLNPDIMALFLQDALPEYIRFAISEELNLADSIAVSGFSVDGLDIDSAYYTSKGNENLITLFAVSDLTWTNSSLVSYDSVLGNVVDTAGNPMATITDHVLFAADEIPPEIEPDTLLLLLNGSLPETIEFTINEELNLNENDTVYGFTSSTGFIDYAIYTGKGSSNTITLTSVSDQDWTDATTLISYDDASGNVVDTWGNELAIFTDHITIDGTSPELFPDIMTLFLNGTAVESIVMHLNEEINLDENGGVTGFVSSNGIIDTAFYTGKGTTNTITLLGTSNGSWVAGLTTISYISGNVLDLTGNELLAIANHVTNAADETPPAILPDLMNVFENGNLAEIISFTLSEEIALNDSALILGFSTSTGAIDSAVYTGKGSTNTISLYALNNNSWIAGVTTVSYDSVAGNVADSAGNEMEVITDHVTADNIAPVLSPNTMLLFLNDTNPETVIFTLSEELNINENDTVLGFVSSQGTIDHGIYSEKGSGNLITLTSLNDGEWTAGVTTISYITGIGGNVIDFFGNELNNITTHITDPADETKPAIVDSLVYLALNSDTPEKIYFYLDEELDLSSGEKVLGLSVSEGEIDSAYYHKKGTFNQITIVASQDGSWSAGVTTISYSPSLGNITDYFGNHLDSLNNFLTIAADETGPVITFSPANDETGVALNTQVLIAFSEAVRLINDGEITDGQVVESLITFAKDDRSGEAVNFTATILNNKKEITIVPDMPLESLQYYFVAIENSVEDDFDNAILPDSLTFFTIDTFPPVLQPDTMILYNNNNSFESIIFTINKKLQIAEGGNVTGFTCNLGTISSAIYTAKGSSNTITLINSVNDTWHAGITTISYDSAFGNVVDTIGNALYNIVDHLTLDGSPPIILNAEIIVYQNDINTEKITFRLDEELVLDEGANVTGFSVNEGSIASAIYTGKGLANRIEISNLTNETWSGGSTTLSYDNAIGNITDTSNNAMESFLNHFTIQADETSPELLRDTIFLVPNAANPEFLFFYINEELDIIEGGTVNGFSVTTVDTTYVISGIYNGAGISNKITLTSNQDNEFIETSSVNYDPASGNVVDLSGNELAAIANHPVILDIFRPYIDPDVMIVYQNGNNSETIIFTISEEIDLVEGTDALGFSVNEGILATAIYSGKGSTNTITLSSQNDGEWSGQTTLVTYITGGNIIDFNNLELDPIIDHSVIAADETAPQVFFTPADSTLDVLINDSIQIKFDEQIYFADASTIYDNQDVSDLIEMRLTDMNGMLILINAYYSLTDTAIIVKPFESLESETWYYVALPTNKVEDSWGNENLEHKISFKTEDVISPQIVSLNPLDNQGNVNLNSNLTITFSEFVKADSGHISIYDENNNLFNQIEINDSNVVFIDNQVSINPQNDFSGATSYYILIPDSVITDVSSNQNRFEGIIDNTQWNFTTVDNIAPVVQFEPENAETEIALQSNIIITFSEPIRFLNNSEITNDLITDEIIFFRKDSIDGLVIPYLASISTNKRQITVDPVSDFGYSEQFFVQLNNIFEDTANNAVPISYIKFTTEIQPAPQVGDVEACYGDTNVYIFSIGTENGIIRWYNQPILNEANLIHSGSIFYPGILDPGLNTFYITDYLNGYESAFNVFNFMVHPLPEKPIIDGPNSSCHGNPEIWVDSIYLSYQWFLDGNMLNEITNSIITSSIGNYSIEIEDSNTCFNISDEHIINEQTFIEPEITGNDSLCPGKFITTEPINYIAYQWKKATDEIIPGATSYKFYPVESDSYIVEVTDSNNCIGTSTERNITVFDTVTPQVILKGKNILICKNLDSFYTNYQWYNINRIPGAIEQFYVAPYPPSGDFYVEVVNKNACIIESNHLVFDGLKSNNKKLLISPNPVHTKLNITIADNINDNVLLNIYDDTGVKVYSKNLILSDYNNSASINIKNLVVGQYILEIINIGESYYERFIKY